MTQIIGRREFFKKTSLGAAVTLPAIQPGFASTGDSSRQTLTTSTVFEDTIPIPRPAHSQPTLARFRGYSGSIAPLNGGSLLFACGNPLNQIQRSGIIGRISTDKGRTWGGPFSMQLNFAREGTVAPSLLRLKDGRLLFAYDTSNNYQGPNIRLYDGQVYVRYSTDEALSWTSQACATVYPGYQNANPDRVIQLSSGRIVIPVEWTRKVGGGEAGHMVCLCYYTDDGYTWIRSRNFVDTGKTTEEPSVVELKDDRLLMVFRNLMGYVGRAYSHDGGDTWTGVGFYNLPSPLAPQYITRIPTTGDLLLLWLNNPHAPGLAKGEKQPRVKFESGLPNAGTWEFPLGRIRAPLTSAISRDEGRTWEHIRNITSDPHGDYGYQGVTFVGDVALVNYNALDGIHVTRIGIDWFYGK